MKIPWIPQSSCLPRAICCSLAKECPNEPDLAAAEQGHDRFLQGGNSTLCSWIFLLFPPASGASFTFPGLCPHLTFRASQFPVSRPCGEAPSYRSDPWAATSHGSARESSQRSLWDSQIPSPRHHRAAWTLGKALSGNFPADEPLQPPFYPFP